MSVLEGSGTTGVVQRISITMCTFMYIVHVFVKKCEYKK